MTQTASLLPMPNSRCHAASIKQSSCCRRQAANTKLQITIRGVQLCCGQQLGGKLASQHTHRLHFYRDHVNASVVQSAIIILLFERVIIRIINIIIIIVIIIIIIIIIIIVVVVIIIIIIVIIIIIISSQLKACLICGSSLFPY